MQPETNIQRVSMLSLIENAIEDGIDAAARYVSSLPDGEKTWDAREYRIAEKAARAAIAAFRQPSIGSG